MGNNVEYNILTEPINPCCVPDDRLDDFFWFVGWLEGEGCFHSNRRRQPYIKVGVTDKDIANRGKIIMDAPSIVHIDGTRRHRKDSYQIAVSGQHAIDWLDAMIPFLGERRRSKAMKVLNLSDKRSGYAKGSRNKNSKITEADVSVIRKMYKDGVSQRQIAERFPITQTVVSDIVRKESWQHVA